MKSVIVDSPVGRLLLVAENEQLVQLHFENEDLPIGPGSKDPVLSATSKQLVEYFAGRRKSFELPMEMKGTDFERSVWKALLEIPFGETVSYGEIARRIGNPKSVRAVGRANGKNPIAIIVPCHRVIGSDGSLTGYGGGEPRKRWLLDHESGDRRLFTEPLSTLSRSRSNLSRS
jgi:methylated-DNA-[protein]-cysteine S-methyltransferase